MALSSFFARSMFLIHKGQIPNTTFYKFLFYFQRKVIQTE
jgi:hypothetical protein